MYKRFETVLQHFVTVSVLCPDPYTENKRLEPSGDAPTHHQTLGPFDPTYFALSLHPP
jgi:hypothetical protein